METCTELAKISNTGRRKGDSMDRKQDAEKMSAREVLTQQWFLAKLCFSASPKGMALHLFESIKLQVSIFFESIWVMNYVLGVAERGESWGKIVWCMVLFMLAVALSTVTFSYYMQSGLPKLKPVLYRAFRMHIYTRMKDLDLQCYDQTDFYQKFILAAEESDACIDRFLDTTELYCAKGTNFLLSFGYCIFVNPLILIVPFLFLPLELRLAAKENSCSVASRMERLPFEQKREYQNRVFYLADYAKDLRLNPKMKEKCRNDFQDSQTEIRRVHKKYGKRLVFYAAFRDALIGGCAKEISAWMLLLYQLLVQGTLSFAHMLVSFRAVDYVGNSMTMLLNGYKKMLENSAYIRRIRSLADMEPSIVSEKNLPMPQNPGEFDVSHVSFSYQGAGRVLHDISIRIRPKQKIALVGYNGSGKTTLVKLLLRLYDPQEGSIRYNGTDIRDYEVTAYRHSIGCVFQDFKIYAATLKENVLMDVSKNTKEESYEVEKALYDAHFTLKDQRLLYQIETPLTAEFEKDGVNLSGGEMQKAAIARTLYRRQKAVIMDEPSSALDPLAEYQLNQEMNETAKEKTVIFISHRLSATRDADCIYMMEHGRVIEKGSHEELMELGGKYAAMWEVQAGLYRQPGNLASDS